MSDHKAIPIAQNNIDRIKPRRRIRIPRRGINIPIRIPQTNIAGRRDYGESGNIPIIGNTTHL